MSFQLIKPRVVAGAMVAIAACLSLAASASAAGSASFAAISRPCLFGSGPPACFGPADFAQAYNFPAGLDGTGQTIVILTPYGSATLQSDLAVFDRVFGLPDPPSLTVVKVRDSAPCALTGGPPDLSQAACFFALETSLDVEYAHALAPGANIVVAQAASEDNADIVAAAAKALPLYPGAVVSMSFGDFETDPTAGSFVADLHSVFVQATALQETLVAASGDLGATFSPFTGADTPVAGYPASDPLVTSVGGTMGFPGPSSLLQNGAYGGEQVWNEPPGASGGAPSILFKAPPWQKPVTDYKTRTVPDVAFNAEAAGGTTVFAFGRPTLVGGTSLGAPAWAAIFALVNQARASLGRDPIGLASDNLYKLAHEKKNADDFHDITIGNNAYFSSFGFAAGPGYDLATGLGTPNVANLVGDLAKAHSGAKVDGEILKPPRPQEPHGHKPHKPHTVVVGQGD